MPNVQVVARKGKRQASQPDSEVQSEGQESVNAFDKDDSEDEDARTLGKFGWVHLISDPLH